MKKICVFTGTRAEYGLLFQLIKKLKHDDQLKLQLIATGMHLSPEFGLTYKEIEKDGFSIDKKIEILLSSDTAVGISKTIGLAQISFAEALEGLEPDLLIILGDRTEAFAVASSALIAGIPIAHIHGGELTEGVYDDAIRHSITKMSHLHFTSTEDYRKRVIQLGEQPSTVFNVGAIGLDNIKHLKLLNKKDLEKAIGFKLGKKNILATFHPVTLENLTAQEQFNELLKVFEELPDTHIIFTKPNSDKGGRIITHMIDTFVKKYPERSVEFESLGQLRYLSTMKHVDIVIGNSSSGILEAPAFNMPTVNIGDRQKGRIMGETILNCEPNKNSIRKSIEKAFQFNRNIKRGYPYGNGTASEKILKILKETSSIDIKKIFYDCKISGDE